MSRCMYVSATSRSEKISLTAHYAGVWCSPMGCGDCAPSVHGGSEADFTTVHGYYLLAILITPTVHGVSRWKNKNRHLRCHNEMPFGWLKVHDKQAPHFRIFNFSHVRFDVEGSHRCWPLYGAAAHTLVALSLSFSMLSHVKSAAGVLFVDNLDIG